MRRRREDRRREPRDLIPAPWGGYYPPAAWGGGFFYGLEGSAGLAPFEPVGFAPYGRDYLTRSLRGGYGREYERWVDYGRAFRGGAGEERTWRGRARGRLGHRRDAYEAPWGSRRYRSGPERGGRR